MSNIDPVIQDPTAALDLAEEQSASAAILPEGVTELPEWAQPGAYVENGEEGLGDPSVGPLAPAGRAFIAGGLQSVFETMDTLFGEPAAEDRTEFRKGVEAGIKSESAASTVNGFAAGLGQFATGMLGVGKAATALKGVSYIGTAAGIVSKSSTARAAITGAVAFDPHQERLSNLVQGTALANPVTEWLAADPEDSAAEGRVKAVIESLGMDTVLGGVFMASGAALRKLKAGDAEGAVKTLEDLEARRKADLAAEPQVAPVASTAEPALTMPGATAEAPQVPLVAEVEPSPAVADEALQTPAIAEDVTPTPVVSDAIPAAPAKPFEAFEPVSPDDMKGPNVAAIDLGEENTASILEGMRSDSAFLEKANGNWYGAVVAAQAEGKPFGSGKGINFNKLNLPTDVDDMVARIADASLEKMDAIKGGAVQTWESVDEAVNRLVRVTGDDPSELLGRVQQAGGDMRNIVAHMEAGYLLADSAFMRAYALAERINLDGGLSEFGGDLRLAREEVNKVMSVAVSALASAKSISSNMGRGLNRMRKPMDPAMLEAMLKVSDRDFFDTIRNTGGDPAKLAKIMNATILGKLVDGVNFVRINGFVSGWKTQLVNLMGSGVMLGIRPLAHILGGSVQATMGNTAGMGIVKTGLKQYAYMGTALMDGFGAAKLAFLRNEGVLVPNTNEIMQGGSPRGAMQPIALKPDTGIANRTYNLMALAMMSAEKVAKADLGMGTSTANVIGLPTRVLGTVDELMKQTVYRSKVAAGTHVDAVEEGLALGLKGSALRDFVGSRVQKAMDGAFDAEGRATNKVAMEEAQIATFQQDLLEGTLGKSLMGFNNRHPSMKLLLPFVKTPTNLIRYGVKLTPGLNYLLQQEYRQMLHGDMGAEVQAQAMGQMLLGFSFVGAAAYASSHGTITGGGPSDYKQKEALLATGWQPYSVAYTKEDGTTGYFTYGRLDPIAIPFGIIADLQDAIHALDEEDPNEYGIGDAISALGLALAKQFSNKTYLLGLNDALDAVKNPEERMGPYLERQATTFVPFSSAMRQGNPDNYMREARTMADRVLALVPGLSEKLPAKYDAFGDPLLVRNGIWSQDVNGKFSIVDMEMQRLALVSGQALTRVQPKPQADVDLREITMADGRNAYASISGSPGTSPAPIRSRRWWRM